MSNQSKQLVRKHDDVIPTSDVMPTSELLAFRMLSGSTHLLFFSIYVELLLLTDM